MFTKIILLSEFAPLDFLFYNTSKTLPVKKKDFSSGTLNCPTDAFTLAGTIVNELQQKLSILNSSFYTASYILKRGLENLLDNIQRHESSREFPCPIFWRSNSNITKLLGKSVSICRLDLLGRGDTPYPESLQKKPFFSIMQKPWDSLTAPAEVRNKKNTGNGIGISEMFINFNYLKKHMKIFVSYGFADHDSEYPQTLSSTTHLISVYFIENTAGVFIN